MDGDEDTLVRRRPKRSTAGNRCVFHFFLAVVLWLISISEAQDGGSIG